MIKIYLDTNFLMIPAQFRVDIFEEIKRISNFPYELCVLEKSLKELEKIKNEQKGKHREASKLAIGIINQKIKQKSLNITTFSKDIAVDDILVELANSDTIVATQDKELKKRIQEKGGKLIVLRNKTHLEIT